MQVDLNVEIHSERADEPKKISRVLDEGEPLELADEGGRWGIRITPKEVTQMTDTKDDLEECPVCGDPVQEIALQNHIGESINVDRVCLEDTDIEDRDFMLYYHR